MDELEDAGRSRRFSREYLLCAFGDVHIWPVRNVLCGLVDNTHGKSYTRSVLVDIVGIDRNGDTGWNGTSGYSIWYPIRSIRHYNLFLIRAGIQTYREFDRAHVSLDGHQWASLVSGSVLMDMIYISTVDCRLRLLKTVYTPKEAKELANLVPGPTFLESGANPKKGRMMMSEQAFNQSEICANYAEGPNRLEAAIAGLSETGLDAALNNDSWTIRQIIHHITDGDDTWKGFIKRAIGNPGGNFMLEWYWQIPQTEWAEHWAYRKRAIEPSLALFRASRCHIVQLLEHIPGAWGNSLRLRLPNGEEQEVSIGWVMDMQSRHVDEHIGDIRRIREVHGI